jgi:imidazolonepropionase-like amidohydrolase
LHNLPANFDSLNSRRDSAAILAAAGVTIAFAETSAEGLAQNARNITQAAGVAVASGLPWIAALEAITITPARLYGVSDQLGSLEAGKVADFVIWSGDPLELTNYPDKVFIDGHEISMTTRQSLLRDRYLNLKTDRPPAFN